MISSKTRFCRVTILLPDATDCNKNSEITHLSTRFQTCECRVDAIKYENASRFGEEKRSDETEAVNESCFKDKNLFVTLANEPFRYIYRRFLEQTLRPHISDCNAPFPISTWF